MCYPRQVDAKKAFRLTVYGNAESRNALRQGHVDTDLVRSVPGPFDNRRQEALIAGTGHVVPPLFPPRQRQGVGGRRAGRVTAEFPAHHVDAHAVFRPGRKTDIPPLFGRQVRAGEDRPGNGGAP